MFAVLQLNSIQKATKFYTEEGNFDLVGNNMPVFFIQDAIKFPDFIHAVKPEPDTGYPQAASAHDTFWDFIANNQESAHMVMVAYVRPRYSKKLADDGRVRGGVHTFRFVNDEGKAHFVKFHWKPKLGIHSAVWDEAQKINGKNPDFNRQDIHESIENGDYPEWELGVQIVPEEDEFKFDFDVLDPTKIWPEEDVPVKIIGKMTLNRNVDNVFAETEQVAFHPGSVVPGIDFSNDPLLQGRLFSYTDTQLIRLGGPNFHELPINRPVCPFHNNQPVMEMDMGVRQLILVSQVIIITPLLTTLPPLHLWKKVDMSIIRKKSKGGKYRLAVKVLKIISLKRQCFGIVCQMWKNSISKMLSALSLEWSIISISASKSLI